MKGVSGMALSGKYGRISVSGVADDEPVFVLRAQDRLAEAAIEMYRLLAASHGCAIAESLQREVDRFRQWKGPKKLPD